MSSLLLFLVFVSMHACNARSLALFDTTHLVLTKDFETTSTPEKDSTALTLIQQQATLIAATSGNNNALVHSQIDLQEEDKLTEDQVKMQRRRRSILGSEDNTEEAVESNKENDMVEDIVVMDYAQPHRKPPIHNEKP